MLALSEWPLRGRPCAISAGQIIEEDLRTINSFYVGKEAELEGMVQDLEKASQHAYLMEWKGDMGYFAKIYKEVCQLIR